MKILIGAICLASVLADTSFAELSESEMDPAENLLLRNGVEIDGRYVVIRHVPYESGGGMIMVHQVHEDLVVFDSEAAFHYTSEGELRRTADGAPELMGIVKDVDEIAVDPDRLIDEAEAIEIFGERTRIVTIPDITGRRRGALVNGPECAQDPEAIDAQLGIYRETVAWRVRCREKNNPLMYIDASNGRALTFDSGYRSIR